MGAPDPARIRHGVVKAAELVGGDSCAPAATGGACTRSRTSCSVPAAEESRLVGSAHRSFPLWRSSRRESRLNALPRAARSSATLIRRLSVVLDWFAADTAKERTAAILRKVAHDRGPLKRCRTRRNQACWIGCSASPHFGERWARHWMDVVRFTETHGNEWNYDVHHAQALSRLPDPAFNDDVPYDQPCANISPATSCRSRRWNQKEPLQRIGHRHRVLSLRRGQLRRLHRACSDRLRSRSTIRSTRSRKRSRQ